MEARLKKVLIKGAVILSVGCAYSVWVLCTGTGIPCAFHVATGYLCPGCGVTRMLVSLLRLDFAAAFRWNAVLLCLLPVLLTLLVVSLVRYVRTGSRKMSLPENIAVWCAIAVLLAWGVVRNLI